MKWIIPVMLMAILCSGVTTSCITTGGSLVPLSEMTETDFATQKVMLKLTVKVTARRALEENTLSTEDLELGATILETIRDQSVIPGAESLVKAALADAGVTNDEVELLLLLVEGQLRERGALELMEDTQMIILSPRAEELLTTGADALRTVILEAAQPTATIIRNGDITVTIE